MQYISFYPSPLGEITLAADDIGLTGLWFQGQKFDRYNLEAAAKEQELPVFAQAKQWLDVYFSGMEPDFVVPLHLLGTAFQKEVWEILRWIPYGKTMTYGEIAKLLAEKRGIPTMAAQAVGGAVGKNPISVIVPCHRVMGANGNLTGYAGGVERKNALLRLEGIQTLNLFAKR